MCRWIFQGRLPRLPLPPGGQAQLAPQASAQGQGLQGTAGRRRRAGKNNAPVRAVPYGSV